MISVNEYFGHIPEVTGKRNKFDNTIYTFDIETTSYIELYGKQYNALDYLNFTQEEKDNCTFLSNMYIFMFSINDTVFYGRTWDELKNFMTKIDIFTHGIKKYVFVHNLSYEFQFLRNAFKFKNVFSRKSRKVIKFELEDLNFEFRCTYYMTNVKLEKLAKIYQLPVKKLTGNLDYTKIRHSGTKLTSKELSYCENDCLVIFHYIKLQLKEYKTVKNLPLTATGFVRRELKEIVDRNYGYKRKVGKSINIDGHIFNLMEQAFQGGYTHANWTLAR